MFTTLLNGHGFTFETWDIENQQFPQSVSQADGWLITGSRHGVYENHPWIKPLETFVRQAYETHIPMVGVCFGHQIIAQALGGTVTKFSGGWNIGHTDYTFEGAPLALNAWHQDQVTQIPADARVIGQNNFCENAFLLYGNRAFTLQAHPEFEAEFIEGLARTRAPGVVPTDLIEAAYEALDNPIQNQVIAKRIADFFKLKRP
jgi:GMP synthase (glutamine-hydrolysing)